MQRIVFDANVWFSATSYPGPMPLAAIGLVRFQQVDALNSDPILDQIVRALRKAGATAAQCQAAVTEMRRLCELVAPQSVIHLIAGKPFDNRVLESAQDGAVDFIVSGDRKHLLALGAFEGIPIVSPHDVVTRFSLGQL